MNLRAESRQLKLLDVGSTLIEEASAESLHAYIAKTHIRDPAIRGTGSSNKEDKV